MSRSGIPVELDFFRMEKENSSKSKLFQHSRSFKGIQGAISKLNPELLKSVINSESVVVDSEKKSLENHGCNLKQETKQNLFSPLSLFNPIPRCSSSETPMAPLTIFYDGKVSVFNVPCNKAEKLMKLAENVESKSLDQPNDSNPSKPETCSSSSSSCDDGNKLLEKLNGDFPYQRKKSLQMFLQKRKARLTLNSPYANSQPMVEKSKELV